MKLDWNIETKRGTFHAGTLENAIQSMINYYFENEEDPKHIISIEAYQDGEIVHQINKEEINNIQDRIEKEVKNLQQELLEEIANDRLIRSEYRAAIL